MKVKVDFKEGTEGGDMQKIITSIIISAGLILSASIISSKNKVEIGRYEVKNAKIIEDYMAFGKDSYTATRDELIKIDTVTGKVWRHRQGITTKNEDYDKWELLGES